jgi:hypothetical protein
MRRAEERQRSQLPLKLRPLGDARPDLLPVGTIVAISWLTRLGPSRPVGSQGPYRGGAAKGLAPARKGGGIRQWRSFRK